MELQNTNNATTVLGAPITDSATSCDLATGTGALFPALETGQAFKATLVDAATGLVNEIVLVEGISGDTITSMLRGQEGTTAVSWLAGDHFSNLLTAATMKAALSGQLQGAPVVFDTPGDFTYTPSAGTVGYIVEVLGGGGGGGGSGVTGSTTNGAGGPGNAGAYAKHYGTLTPGETVAITVGAGGAGNVGGTGTAADGGTSSFGSTVICDGGAGGQSPVTTVGYTSGNGNVAAVTAGGNIVAVPGACGHAGFSVSDSNTLGGHGADSPMGSGGPGVNGSNNGQSATGYGAGGGGSSQEISQSATRNGGNGSGGIVIVYEFS